MSDLQSHSFSIERTKKGNITRDSIRSEPKDLSVHSKMFCGKSFFYLGNIYV